MKQIKIACLNKKCAKSNKHIKSCVAYGNDYPTKLVKSKDLGMETNL